MGFSLRFTAWDGCIMSIAPPRKMIIFIGYWCGWLGIESAVQSTVILFFVPYFCWDTMDSGVR